MGLLHVRVNPKASSYKERVASVTLTTDLDTSAMYTGRQKGTQNTDTS